jgi:methyl-accepting chemotaxis protein
MFGLSIRSLLIGLFALMALIIGGEGLLSINKIAAVNESVVELATNWMPSINVVRQLNTIAEQRRANVARHILMTTDEEMKAQDEVFKKLTETFEAARKRYEPMIIEGE